MKTNVLLVSCLMAFASPAYADDLDDLCKERDRLFEQCMAQGCTDEKLNAVYDKAARAVDMKLSTLDELCKKRDAYFAQSGNLDFTLAQRNFASERVQELADEINRRCDEHFDKQFHENTAEIFKILSTPAKETVLSSEELEARSNALCTKQKKLQKMLLDARTDEETIAAEKLYDEVQAESEALGKEITKIFEAEAPAMQKAIDEITAKANELQHPTFITYCKAYTYCGIFFGTWIPRHIVKAVRHIL